MRYELDHELTKLAITKLLDKSWHENHLNNYGVVSAEGKIDTRPGQPCYYALCSSPFKPLGELALFFDYVRPYDDIRLSKKDRYNYIKWCAEESPWKDIFVTKDPKFILKHGCVYNTDQCAPLVIGAAMAIRQSHEIPRYAKAWSLLKKVLDPHRAYIYSLAFDHTVLESETNWRISNFFGGGHTNLSSGELGKKGLKRFIDGEPAKWLKKNRRVPFSRSTNFEGICRVWAEAEESLVNEGHLDIHNDEMKKSNAHFDQWAKKEIFEAFVTPKNIEAVAKKWIEVNG